MVRTDEKPIFKWPNRTRGILSHTEMEELEVIDAKLVSLKEEIAATEKRRDRFLYGAPVVLWFRVPGYPWWKGGSLWGHGDGHERSAAVLVRTHYDEELVSWIAAFWDQHEARERRTYAGDWAPSAEWLKRDKVWAVKPSLFDLLIPFLQEHTDALFQQIKVPAPFVEEYGR